MTNQKKVLTELDRQIYEWQMWVPEFGEVGQEKLKNTSILVSRCGGLGSVVAYELAAAGVGKLVLAHAGNLKHSDLNRQLLMTYDHLGKPRIESVQRKLRDLNPHMEIEAYGENVSELNARELVSKVDLIIDCAPLFEERFAMNQQAVVQSIPLVECAMYDLEALVTTIIPYETPCLACLYPDHPPIWTREFPVFGAVSGMIGCIAVMEAIKIIAGFGHTLKSKMLNIDLRSMKFQIIDISPASDCHICGHL